MVDKILAIQNCGPSGTLLLQSLLDSHSQLISLPALHGQQLLIQWKSLARLNREALVKKFIEMNAHWFNPDIYPGEDLGLSSMGNNFDERVEIDQNSFKNHLDKQLSAHPKITRKSFIISVFYAYNLTLGRDISRGEYIVYPIHSLPKKFAAKLVKDFKQVRFLHTVRNPIQSMGSMFKHLAHNASHRVNLYFFRCIISQLINDFTIHAGPHRAYGMKPYFEDTADGRIQSRAVKLEDIHKDSVNTMKKVCKWLHIEFEPSLLQSTFDGKIWNNRPASIRQSGIGNTIIAQQHNDVLTNFDKLRLEYASMKFMKHYQYELTHLDGKKINKFKMLCYSFAPFQIENFKTGLAQRYEIITQDRQKTKEMRLAYGKLGKVFSKSLLHSKTADLALILLWQTYQYLACRVTCLIPSILNTKGKPEYVPLID